MLRAFFMRRCWQWCCLFFAGCMGLQVRVMCSKGRVLCWKGKFFRPLNMSYFVRCCVLRVYLFCRCSKGKKICPSNMFCCPSNIFHIICCWMLCTHRRQRVLRRLQAERQRRARPKGSPLTVCLLRWLPSPFN